METDAALAALTALSHQIRLQAFRELVQAGPDGLNVGQLRVRLQIPRPRSVPTSIRSAHPAWLPIRGKGA